jgi:hypothetical protein
MKPDPFSAPADRNLLVLLWASRCLALISLLVFLMQIFGCPKVAGKMEPASVAWLMAAGVLLLLPRLKTFAFGGVEMEFEEMKKLAQQSLDLSKVASDAARISIPANSTTGSDAKWPDIQPNPEKPDDPWKGQFGGLASSGGCYLRAEVKPIIGESDWFIIHLEAGSTDPRSPLNGVVKFFLHPTFAANKPEVIARFGKSELWLKAWGAFTVGALVNGDRAKLELDLEENRTFPALFRSR